MSAPLIQSGGGGSSTAAFIRNPQTGTSYAIQDSDSGKTLELSNATANTVIALTIAQAGAAGVFANNWFCSINNIGQNAAILTPTTSTIAGVAGIFIPPGCGVTIYSDGTNYQVKVEGPNSAASSGQGGFGSWGLTGPVTTTNANITIAGSTIANTLKVAQFTLATATVIRRASFWIGTTAAAGQKAFVGLYDANKNKILQETFSTTTASTRITNSSFSSIFLLPGVYYYVIGCDSITPTTDTITVGSGTTGSVLNAISVKNGTAGNLIVAGVLPATLGTITAINPTMGLTWFEA